MDADVIVVGGGLVGSAIGYGLVRRDVRVLVLDGEDRAFRASNANGGLVWLQGKGLNMSAYQQLSRDSADLWPDFSSELVEASGVDIQFRQTGGLKICFGEQEYEQRRALMMRWHNQQSDWEMIDRAALDKLLPKVKFGADIAGASFGHRDCQLNPLYLLAALHIGIGRRGGQVRGGATVHAIEADGQGGFTVKFGSEQASAARIVIAAGLGSKAIAAEVGLNVPLRPQRGQMLITERMEPFLPIPLHAISQTDQGTVMAGTTNEEAGYDSSTTMEGLSGISAMLVRAIPTMRDVKLVRQWAGLRIMTPDSAPIYAESESHPGVFVAICHSGVTLAAVHAGLVAEAVVAGRLPASLDEFHQRRFDVPKAA